MSKIECVRKEHCRGKCQLEFVDPDYGFWNSEGITIPVGKKILRVAPEDVFDSKGNRFWAFSAAQDISKMIYEESGWRLPTPVEAQLIATMTAYECGQKEVTSELLINTFGFELPGIGKTDGICSGYNWALRKGEAAVYWTDSMRKWPEGTSIPIQSAIVYQLSIQNGFLYTAAVDDVAGMIRLVREV